VAVLAPDAYGGYKDVHEAWAAGVLAVGAWPAAAGAEGPHKPPGLQDLWDERASIMQFEGGLSRPAAEQAAWRALLTMGVCPMTSVLAPAAHYSTICASEKDEPADNTGTSRCEHAALPTHPLAQGTTSYG